ncbi:hypothetical protein BRD19_12260 [Halobacteriales archaeon SW_7_65_23]|nr:MAG: hypothetical protein BRD19_12260 [Halobacteriales archaeon SW_7_65_23]
MTSSDSGRGVSTVVDVTLALLLLGAALAVLVTFAEAGDRDHEPMETEYTTETVVASTMNTTYYPEEALGRHYGGDVYEKTDYERRDLRRVSHGPVVTQVADVAMTEVTFDRATLGGDGGGRTTHLSRAAAEYHARVDEQLQARLVNVSFRTHVAAVWEPIEGGPILGEAEVGPTPPAREDVSATTITLRSDVPAVRDAAVEAVEHPDDFDVVAEIVAEAVVEGYFPELESQRALEGGGVDRDLTVYRYRNMADMLAVDGRDREEFETHLTRERANATAANQLLIAELAAQLTAYLEPASGPPENGPHGDAAAAAASITTGTVTVTVRTWT